MLNICVQCGKYRADKEIDPSGPFAVCPECGHRQPFLQLPLFMVSGASGTGKSTALHHLLGVMNETVLLDSDILWRREFDTPGDHYQNFMETWLRVCKDISQSGKPVMLFGAGTGVPENIEPCVERRYFSNVHYLALVCDEPEIERRLLSRPDWRNCQNTGFVDAQKDFNRWFVEYRDQHRTPPIELIDTTCFSVEETALKIQQWCLAILRLS